VHRLWDAVTSGRVIPPELVEEMTRPRSSRGPGKRVYGLGMWLHPDHDHVLELEGYDAGASFHSLHDRTRRITWTVISNTSDGAWPLVALLGERV
jgi:hypothetical protein